MTASTSRPGEPAGRDLGLGHGRRGEHERRVGAVRRADPPQPAQHLGDVGAEDPAVVVALVDHDVAQRAQERAPSAAWPGSSERCSMSGLVRTYSAWSRAQSRCSRRAVAVVGGDPDVEAERGEPGAAGPGPAPWWGRGRARWRRAPARPAAAARSRSARAAGRPATCRRRCRWRARRAARRAPRSAAAAWCCHGRSTPRARVRRDARAGGTQSGQRRRRAGRGGQHARGGSAGPRARARRPAGRTRSATTRRRAPRAGVTRQSWQTAPTSRTRPTDGALTLAASDRQCCATLHELGSAWFHWPAECRVGDCPATAAESQGDARGPDSCDARGRRARPSSRSVARSTSTPRPSCATRSPSWSPPAPTTSSSTWRRSSSSTPPVSACSSAA